MILSRLPQDVERSSKNFVMLIVILSGFITRVENRELKASSSRDFFLGRINYCQLREEHSGANTTNNTYFKCFIVISNINLTHNKI